MPDMGGQKRVDSTNLGIGGAIVAVITTIGGIFTMRHRDRATPAETVMGIQADLINQIETLRKNSEEQRAATQQELIGVRREASDLRRDLGRMRDKLEEARAAESALKAQIHTLHMKNEDLDWQLTELKHKHELELSVVNTKVATLEIENAELKTHYQTSADTATAG